MISLSVEREFGTVSDGNENAKVYDIRAAASTALFERDDFEPERPYIPLDLAKGRINILAKGLKEMKDKHLKVITEVTKRYEDLTAENRRSYQVTFRAL